MLKNIFPFQVIFLSHYNIAKWKIMTEVIIFAVGHEFRCLANKNNDAGVIILSPGRYLSCISFVPPFLFVIPQLSVIFHIFPLVI